MLDFTQRVSRFSLSVVVAASLAFVPVAAANTAFAAESDDLTAQADELAAMIILPECTYANDCTVVDLTPEQQFEIVR